MRVILKPGLLALAVETEEERAAYAAWRAAMAGRVLLFDGGSPDGGAFRDLGPQAAACREPINVVFDGPAEWRPISNLAETPFVLDGREYASVEGFWQGLKSEAESDRRRIAGLSGREARRAGQDRPRADGFTYAGARVATGGPAHHQLMRRACMAKFTQHPIARETLLATGTRPLEHRVRRDSVTIPGALMADIWMRIRARLAGETERAAAP